MITVIDFCPLHRPFANKHEKVRLVIRQSEVNLLENKMIHSNFRSSRNDSSLVHPSQLYQNVFSVNKSFPNISIWMQLESNTLASPATAITTFWPTGDPVYVWIRRRIADFGNEDLKFREFQVIEREIFAVTVCKSRIDWVAPEWNSRWALAVSVCSLRPLHSAVWPGLLRPESQHHIVHFFSIV